MIASLLYKEWLKLRLAWTLLSIAGTILALILFFKLRYVYTINDPLDVWNAWMTKAWLYFRAYQYAPLTLGLVLGLLQYLPEVQAHRIRLVLHLPLGETRAIALHLAIGAALLTAALIPAVALFTTAGIYYFPAEYLHNLLTVLTPPILVGYGAYFATAAILLETNWRHRVLYLLLAIGGLRLFMMENAYDTYERILAPLALWTFALALVPLYSSYRFRKGLR
jgi:hypothetical protein